MLLPSTAASGGSANSVQEQKCGQRGGVAGVKPAFRPDWGSIETQFRQRQEGIHLDHRHQVMEKRRGLEMQKETFENCVHYSSAVKMLKRGKELSSTVGEGRLDEEWKMDVDEEVDSKKKLDQRKKELQKQLRGINEVPDLLQGTRFFFFSKKKRQQELRDVE